LDFIKWRWEALWKDIPAKEDYNFTLAKNDPGYLKSNISQATYTWVGHATILLHLKGKNILTDPQFSQRASPAQWAGPQRVIDPGLSLIDLPRIDMVIISHDHYDSLDTYSIKSLYQRPGGKQTLFYIPLGLKTWFEDLGISNVREMDWWERDNSKELKVKAVPVQHWSKRSAFSQNDTLWAG
jgi:N-acyl-phosphatidylethanolamine-hydrolysing phospholipase D